MYQVLKAVRSTRTVASCRALVSSIRAPAVFNREFHWRKKTKEEKEEKKGKEEKTNSEEVKDDKKNIETKDTIKAEQTKETKPEDVIKATASVENRDKIEQDHYDQLKQDFGIEELKADSDSPNDMKVEMISLGDGNMTLRDFIDNLKDRSTAIESFDNGSFRPEGIKPSDTFQNSMVLPAIPLPVRPIFPGMVERLTFCDRRTIQKLRELGKGDNKVGLFLLKDGQCNMLDKQADVIKNIEDICKVGTYV